MAKVKPIPDGMHTVTPHLIVKGAAQAIEFYKKAFGAVEVLRMPGPDGTSVMHAELKIGDSLVFLADEFPEWGVLSPQALGGSPVTINLSVENADAAAKKAESAGAKITMPVADMFWGDRYGKFVDPFGHNWSVATHVEDLTPEEIGKRGAVEMAKMCKQPS